MTDALLERAIRRPLDGPRPPDATVPCGDCHHCCRNSIVMLLPQHGDDIKSFDHEFVTLPGAGRGPILKRKPNGDCVYLGDQGCTIHGRAPVVCRVFDCRNAYRAIMEHPRAERRRMIADGVVDEAVFERGRELSEGAA